MPMYEFDCADCHKSFEELVLAGADEAVSCPKCRSSHVSKKLSAFAVGGSGGSRDVDYSSSGSSCATGGCCGGGCG